MVSLSSGSFGTSFLSKLSGVACLTGWLDLCDQ